MTIKTLALYIRCHTKINAIYCVRLCDRIKSSANDEWNVGDYDGREFLALFRPGSMAAPSPDLWNIRMWTDERVGWH